MACLGQGRFKGRHDHRERRCVGLHAHGSVQLNKVSNKARAANPAMTSLFHGGHQWRGVDDLERYCFNSCHLLRKS